MSSYVFQTPLTVTYPYLSPQVFVAPLKKQSRCQDASVLCVLLKSLVRGGPLIYLQGQR